MKQFTLIMMLAFTLTAVNAGAQQSKQYLTPEVVGLSARADVHGAPIGTAKSTRDTFYVLGGPDRQDGTFETPAGQPDWHGWTSLDITNQGLHWHVSEFAAIDGSYSMWCGTTFEGGGDPGYGDDWDQYLTYTYTVANPTSNANVRWQAEVHTDTEPEYDFVFMEVNQGGDWLARNADGNGWGYHGDRLYVYDDSFLFRASDYVGENDDEIQLRVHFFSDPGWSDQDNLFDSATGACQVDNLIVTINGSIVESEDFEDGVSNSWIASTEPYVGDYAALYMDLRDMDPCRRNTSVQVAFVDTPDVVPETNTPGVSWRYGPGGYIVNNTGGLAGPAFKIENAVVSPYLVWPDGADAARMDWTVYVHEELGEADEWPGVFFQWRVRSTDSGDPTWCDDFDLLHNGLYLQGGPAYVRSNQIITDYLVQGRTHFQVALVCVERDFGWTGTDGTPAPYFDDVQVVCYPFAGPAVSTRVPELFNDGFPEAGDLDLGDLARNNVRVDMANNIADDGAANDPGDSIFFNVSVVRANAFLQNDPKLYFRMKANPVFDAVRTNFTDIENLTIDDGVISGFIYGDSTIFNQDGGPPIVIPDRFSWDFPDSGFFFPGDEIRYYVEAQDNLSGSIGTTIVPADTTGFGTFNYDLHYDSNFIIRALPTLFSTTTNDQPRVLLWNDFGNRGGENEWLYAMRQLGYKLGRDYDLYYTTAPSSGLGNGLGGRATSVLLGGYTTLLYTSGNLRTITLSNGDLNVDAGNDIGVVSNWLAQGDKNAFMTGDELVTSLQESGATGQAFVNTYFNVNYDGGNISSLIDGQIAALVRATPGNPVIATPREWIANGGCLGINSFDAYTVNAGTERLAEFTNRNGNGGVYNYAAASYHNNAADNADVVLFPYDFMFVSTPPGYTPPPDMAGMSVRTVLLRDILNDFFQESAVGPPNAVTPEAILTVRNYPNPFNPTTTIKLNLPRAGEVSLKVFNVRGELIRTLVDGRLEAGLHAIDWHGETNQGNRAASGVYFYETRADGKVIVKKMAMVK